MLSVSVHSNNSSHLISSSHRFMLVFHPSDMGNVWQYVYTSAISSLHVLIHNSTEFQTNLKYELAAHRPLQTSSLPYRTQLQHLPLLISPKSHLKKKPKKLKFICWNSNISMQIGKY